MLLAKVLRLELAAMAAKETEAAAEAEEEAAEAVAGNAIEVPRALHQRVGAPSPHDLPPHAGSGREAAHFAHALLFGSCLAQLFCPARAQTLRAAAAAG